MSDLTARPVPPTDDATAQITEPVERDLVFTALVDPPPAVDRIEPTATIAAGSTPRPTIRWGALIWSVVFVGLAGLSLWLMIDRAARRDAAEWFASLDAFTAGLYALAALGVLIALFSLVALVRRAERVRS